VINSDPSVKEFGLGLAVAVAVDVTIVRCLIVRARVSRLGRAAWLLRQSLAHRIPDLTIEGDRWFEDKPQGATPFPAPEGLPAR
jgi:RND superfamily putative drug exporter